MKEKTKIGQFMYDLTYSASEKLMENRKLLIALNYTWGILVTLAGWIAYAFCMLFLKKKVVRVEKFAHERIVIIGNNWGGMNLGMVSFVADKMGDSWTQHTKCHETGHSFQNAIFGPLHIFIVCIPSVIRYWYRNWYTKKHKQDINFNLPPYSLIWFEGSADLIGQEYYEKYGSK